MGLVDFRIKPGYTALVAKANQCHSMIKSCNGNYQLQMTDFFDFISYYMVIPGYMLLDGNVLLKHFEASQEEI